FVFFVMDVLPRTMCSDPQRWTTLEWDAFGRLLTTSLAEPRSAGALIGAFLVALFEEHQQQAIVSTNHALDASVIWLMQAGAAQLQLGWVMLALAHMGSESHRRMLQYDPMVRHAVWDEIDRLLHYPGIR